MNPLSALKIAAAALICASPALAWDEMESMILAKNLGTVLAGGEKCGYTFDSSAVSAFIRAKVPADDLGFASMLNSMVVGSGYQLAELPESAIVAHCAMVEQNARHYGFIE